MASQTSESQKTYIEKEIRFAVVMYDSLSIYINGVAQELYNMVPDNTCINMIADLIAYDHWQAKPNIIPGVM